MLTQRVAKCDLFTLQSRRFISKHTFRTSVLTTLWFKTEAAIAVCVFKDLPILPNDHLLPLFGSQPLYSFCNSWIPTKNIPAMKPMIISIHTYIHFKTFFNAKPIAYLSGPLSAKGIILDNKGSLLICSLLRMFWNMFGMKECNHSPSKPTTWNNDFSRITVFACYCCYLWYMACRAPFRFCPSANHYTFV